MLNDENPYCGCLYYSSNALARKMTQMAEESFSITSLAPSYALMLLAINNHPGIQPRELSKLMQLRPSTVTRLIEKMELKEFVKREVSGKNTRVYPTSKGQSLKKTIEEAWENLFKKYAGLLGQKLAQNLTSEIYEASLKLTY